MYTAVDNLSQKLDRWSESLPCFLKETTENLNHYVSIGLGTAFAALHLGFHYYSEVLFYQFLAAANEDQSSTLTVSPAAPYAERCTQHALAFYDVLYACDAATEGRECLYIMLGHMLVVTSTVYVHMLLFNNPMSDSVPIARERLKQNFELLTKLQSYWTTLDASLSRLKTFHRACLKSIENSFRMDHWMLKFILEYGASVPEKFDEPGSRNEGRISVSNPVQIETALTPETLQHWYLQTFIE